MISDTYNELDEILQLLLETSVDGRDKKMPDIDYENNHGDQIPDDNKECPGTDFCGYFHFHHE